MSDRERNEKRKEERERERERERKREREKERERERERAIGRGGERERIGCTPALPKTSLTVAEAFPALCSSLVVLSGTSLSFIGKSLLARAFKRRATCCVGCVGRWTHAYLRVKCYDDLRHQDKTDL